jgi:hypothetical protein
MPKLKKKLRLCKELAAAKKNKPLNYDDDTENLNVNKTLNNIAKRDLEENLLNDEDDKCLEERLLNNEIEEDFEWLDNGIEEKVYGVGRLLREF